MKIGFLRKSCIKDCRQIHKIKQNSFFLWNDLQLLFVIFTEKHQNLTFGSPAEYTPSNPSISDIFLKFPIFSRLQVLSRLETY